MTTIDTFPSSALDWLLRLLLFLARRRGLTFQVVAYHETQQAVLLASSKDVANELVDVCWFDEMFAQAVKQDRAEQHLPPPPAKIRTQKGVH